MCRTVPLSQRPGSTISYAWIEQLGLPTDGAPDGTAGKPEVWKQVQDVLSLCFTKTLILH